MTRYFPIPSQATFLSNLALIMPDPSTFQRDRLYLARAPSYYATFLSAFRGLPHACWYHKLSVDPIKTYSHS